MNSTNPSRLPIVSMEKYGGPAPCGLRSYAGEACRLPAGHIGDHKDVYGRFRPPAPAPATRYSCGRCGLTFPDIFGADQCCSPDPAHCGTCWEPAGRPRERWTFAGRGRSVTDGVEFYVWQLRNPDGTVNSSWLCPVSALLLGGE